jgi:DNA-binding LacI/PurR family transcriptional regulator
MATPEAPLPKSTWLTQQLRTLILQLAPGDSLPTILQLRQQYAVSQPTVDRALQTLRDEGLIESRRGSGIYVTERQQAHRVGLVFGMSFPATPEGQFFRLLWQALQACIARRSLPVRYYFIDLTTGHYEHELDQLRDDIRAREIHGVILISFPTHLLPVPDVPAVTLEHDTLEARMPCITLDNRQLIHLAVETLAAAGCRQLGLLCHNPLPLREATVTAFIDALTTTGLSTRPEWIVPYNIGAAEQAITARWPRWHAVPDGFISDDDNATVDLLRAAATLGIAIPDQLRVVSHANVGSTVLEGMPVTRIAYDVQEVAEALVERLLAQLRGVAREAPQVIRILPRLI